MLKFAVALALAPVSLALASSPVVAQSQSSSLDQVQRHLRTLNTMTANFTQTDRAGRALTGKLFLKQPGRIRFQYQKDAKLLVVGDGKALTMIDYQVNQVQRWPIGNSPLSALVNPKRDIAKYGKLQQTGNPKVVSVEVRDPARPEYGVITMIFTKVASAPAGLRLDGWVALDSKNNRTTVRLSNQRYGAAIANSTFRWTDPRKSTNRPGSR